MADGRLKRFGTLLKNLKLRELSLVRAGANQHAEVILAKDDDDDDDTVEKDPTVDSVHTNKPINKACSCGKMVKSGATCACGKVMKYTAEDAGIEYAESLQKALSDVLEKAVDDNDEIIDDMSEILLDVAKTLPEIVSAAVAKEREERKSAAGTPSGDPINKEHVVAEETEVLKARELEAQKVQKEMKDLQDTVKKQSEAIESQNKELGRIRKEKLTVEVTKTIGSVGVTAEDVVKLYEQVDEAGRKTLDDIFTKANAFAEDAKLFDEVGTTSAMSAGAESELKKAVDVIRKADPKITIEKATQMVLEENPELYDQLDNTQAGEV